MNLCHRTNQGFLGLVLLWGTFGMASPNWAGAPRGIPQGNQLEDRRLGPLTDLNGYFPFHVPGTVADWSSRAMAVRQRILVSQGLWPLPTRSPLNVVVHGRISFNDYSVEKVYFESFPGFFVTGNLYRPVGQRGRVPGVLCPHGHWSEGRFMDQRGIREEIAIGAERFENGGRSVLQSRCVQLARMGCVVFHYDMIGYADSKQITFELAHRFAKQRPEMNQKSGWGLFSPQAESHLQSVMGLQTWNSIRALDFLESLPEVDPGRLAVTGASGGGTQTFMLGALDPRPSVTFPAVMVSTAMQGGCTCENASLLRIGTGNVEFAGLFAPKPLGLTGADDWTVEMSGKGYPELQALYRLLERPEHVMLRALNHFGHNYNYVSRSAMYQWMNRHLKLGLEEPVVEEDYARLAREDLTVWNASHPEPKGGAEFEKSLLKYWHEDSRKKLLRGSDSERVDLDLLRPALRVVVGRHYDSGGQITWHLNEKNQRQGFLEMSGLLRNETYGESVPVVFLYPKNFSGVSVVWLSARGKEGLYEGNGPVAGVRRLLSAGHTVLGIDLLYQGESLAEGDQLGTTRRVANPREAAAYTFGYNHSVFAQRVHDLLSTIRFLKTHDEQSGGIALVAADGSGHWAAVARSVLGDVVAHYAIDTEAFRFGDVDGLHDPEFLPGGGKYLDLPGFLAAGEPTALWLAGESTRSLRWVRSRYSENDDRGLMTVNVSTDSDSRRKAAVTWLLDQLD